MADEDLSGNVRAVSYTRLDVYKRQMKSDLPFGKYYVKEIATDEHYILSDTKYPVVFEYAGQDRCV